MTFDWTDEPVVDLTPLLERLARAEPTPSPVPMVLLPARPVPWLRQALESAAAIDADEHRAGGEE